MGSILNINIQKGYIVGKFSDLILEGSSVKATQREVAKHLGTTYSGVALIGKVNLTRGGVDKKSQGTYAGMSKGSGFGAAQDVYKVNNKIVIVYKSSGTSKSVSIYVLDSEADVKKLKWEDDLRDNSEWVKVRSGKFNPADLKELLD